ncbi:hypothetical protein GDO81_026589 [Engystomops pustulosus]|uniref:Uncharacterized protein n=1 Tax=Engystomops pustulosus TaxID=76066 RepID=A0AAV6YM41_ENGPU|nr:hypothetical protein GDO81_026589 [Engystomops pustulosus]
MSGKKRRHWETLVTEQTRVGQLAGVDPVVRLQDQGAVKSPLTVSTFQRLLHLRLPPGRASAGLSSCGFSRGSLLFPPPGFPLLRSAGSQSGSRMSGWF